MPRSVRRDTIGAYVHVITQGMKKEYIFEKEEYKKEYIRLIKEKFQISDNLYLLCYCIMDNHAHFLIYTENITELSKVMAKINTSFGRIYNKLENRVGYVFRNRYYSQSIKDEKHMYNTIVYIHRNPVKANMVEKMEQYPYSSYNDIKNGKLNDKCINLLFGKKDYSEMFNYIHKNFNEDDILEIKEDFDSDEEVKGFIDKFCKENEVSINIIKKDNEFLNLLVHKIKDKYLVTNKQITEILRIGKNRITNLKKYCN